MCMFWRTSQNIFLYINEQKFFLQLLKCCRRVYTLTTLQWKTLAQSFTFTQSLSHSFSHSVIHSITQSFNQSLSHSLNHPFTQSFSFFVHWELFPFSFITDPFSSDLWFPSTAAGGDVDTDDDYSLIVSRGSHVLTNTQTEVSDCDYYVCVCM